MTRNAAVVLGNVGTADDVDVRTRVTDDAEPPVRRARRLRAGGDRPTIGTAVTRARRRR